ncbi:MAG TPA: hypothetical protein PLO62_12080 [Candidatus Hydrogenedentes bacterium]|nr:hypothetical protein [Candidatus Hydrogenedentota bacterium]HOS02511.1 hypothetical protein [Candidatus Hydrogenedentota bacterium]
MSISTIFDRLQRWAFAPPHAQCEPMDASREWLDPAAYAALGVLMNCGQPGSAFTFVMRPDTSGLQPRPLEYRDFWRL